MALAHRQEKFLRKLAHDRKPVIWLGQNGLTGNVLSEIDTALDHHELIKIKLRVGDRESRDGMIQDICTVTGAEQVQKVGNTVTLFRQNDSNPVITLPG